MRFVDKRGAGAGLLFTASGLGIAIASSSYRLGTADEMGPGYFPLLVGALLALVGIAILISTLGSPAEKTELGHWDLRRLGTVVGALIAFGLLVEPMGLLVAVAALVTIAATAHPQTTWKSILLLNLVLLPMTWAIFVLLLGLQFDAVPGFLAASGAN